MFSEFGLTKGSSMFAVIKTGGKQYKVTEGDVIFIEKLADSDGELYDDGAKVEFGEVLAVSRDEKLEFGSPYIDGAKVTANVVKNGKSKKITVFRYKSKKNEKKKMGHRQAYTKVQIDSISF
jgi:large subunit ribosomal protein L21